MPAKLNLTIAQRLDRGADKSGGSDACWPWKGAKNKGYGVLNIDGQAKEVHRLAWIEEHGPIPEGMCVCHDCPGGDNPACINTRHMFLGTRDANNKDKVAKGGQPRGETAGQAKLTEAAALAILMSPAKQAVLADAFGVDQSTVSNIKTGKRWAHLHA